MGTQQTVLIALEIAVGIIIGFVVWTFVAPYLHGAGSSTPAA